MAAGTPDRPEIACRYSDKNFDLLIPTECTLANGTPCPGCVRQMKLKAQIEETRKLLDELIAEEYQARMEINHYHDPFLLFPVEITAQIFRFTLPDFELQEISQEWLHSESGVLTLGAVCQSWRNIAWSTPRLWSNVMLALIKPLTGNMIEVIKEWLQRSRELPLSIRLTFFEQPQVQDLQTLRFIRLFDDYSARWQDLSIRCDNELFEHFEGNPAGSSHLKTLQLLPYFAGEPWPVFQLKGAMPQPDHVVAMGFRILKNIDISWNNATSVSFERLELVDSIELLRIAPKLINLRLHDLRDSHHLDASLRTPLAHPYLRMLYISTAPLFAITSILDTVTLPSLRELDIHGMFVYRGDNILGTLPLPFNNIMEFFERSSCSLTSFVLELFECEEQPILDILYSLPSSVINVQVDIRNPDQQDLDLFVLFDHLSRNPPATGRISSQSDFLPNLERFEYHVFQRTEIPWGLLPGIARPVSGEKRPFKELTIVERETYHESDYDGQDSSFMIARSRNGEISKSTIHDLIGLQDDGIDLCIPDKLSREFLYKLLDDEDRDESNSEDE